MGRTQPPPPFSFTEWEGGPRLDGCVAALGCRVHAMHEGGDHWIVVGQVIATHRGEDAGEPLVFFGGRYSALANDQQSIDEAGLLIAWTEPGK